MAQDVPSGLVGEDGTRIAPELRAKADRLRGLNDPKLTAPIFDDSHDDTSRDYRPTFLARLRRALFP